MDATQDNQRKFSTLVAQHASIIRKIATTYCRDAEDRADLAQEIHAQLWAAWPRYDASRPFTTWMYRVALNVGISHIRGVYRRARYFEPLADNHDAVASEAVDYEANQRLAALASVIAGLDGMNRALLLLYLDERSHLEIADILGLSESNVGTRIGRLKQTIRARLTRQHGDYPDGT